MGFPECPTSPANSEVTGPRLDETAFKLQFMTLPWLGASTPRSKSVEGSLTRQRQLCVKQTSPYRKKLSFHSRSQNVKMPGPLSGKESEKLLEGKDPRGRSEEAEATGFNRH